MRSPLVFIASISGCLLSLSGSSQLQLTPFDTLCVSGSGYSLTHAEPAGGTWSGPGVADNVFTPSEVGEFTLSYLYDDGMGTVLNGSQSIEVIGVPEIELVGGDPASCNLEPLVFEASIPGGTWSDLVPNGVMDRSCDARPSGGTVAYTIDTGNGGNCYTTAGSYELPACFPINLGPDHMVCSDHDPIEITILASAMTGITDLYGFDEVEYSDDQFTTSATGTFDPSAHSPGVYILSGMAYSGGYCAGYDMMLVTIVEQMAADLVPFDTLCVYGTSYELSHATPAGGTWSGPGVSENVFYPFGPGEFELTYSVYDDLSGCTYTASQQISVMQPEILGAYSSCETTPLELTASPPGGVWTNVADEFGVVDMSCEARPIEDMIEYQVEMANGLCVALQFLQAPGCMPVNLGPDTTLCHESDPIITYLSNSGTSGPGTLIGYDTLVLDEFTAIGSFHPSLHEPGEYVLYGSAGGPGICTGHDSLIVTIAAAPDVQHGLPFTTLFNLDDPVPLEGGIPEGGIYTIAGSTEPLTSFDPGTSGLGEHVLVYSYVDQVTGCFGSDTAFIQVDGGTGITTIGQDGAMTLFPNPADDRITVTFEAARADRILIWDATGRMVSEWSSLSSPAILEIGQLAPGSYTVITEHAAHRDQLMLIVE